MVMIGDSGTGKTSLLLRFAEGVFSPDYRITIGVDFKIKTLKVDDKHVKLQIWDTAGQERFRSVSQAYFRNSDACIAVYDITKRETFESLETQIYNFLTYSVSSDRPSSYFNQDIEFDRREYHQDDGLQMLKNIVLVGTKADLLSEQPRQVSFKEAVEFANKMGLAGVLETSSKTEEELPNIEDSFYICACNCVNKAQRQQEAEEARRRSSKARPPSPLPDKVEKS